MKIASRAFLAVLVSVLIASNAAKAGVYEAGFGPRAIGMGQAQVGAGNDPSAVFYNPACLVQARDRWEINGSSMVVQYGRGTYKSALELNGVNQAYPDTVATNLGVMIPVGKRVTAGLSLYMPEAWTLMILLNSGPRFVRYTQTQVPNGTYGIGIKVTKKFSIGIAQSVAPQWDFTTVTLDINSILAGMGLSLGEPRVNGNPHMEMDTLLGFNYQFGALYRPFKWLSLGVDYRYKIGTRAVIPLYFPAGLVPETNVLVDVNMSWRPTRWSFGVGIYPTDEITVAFDMDYEMWSKINYPYMKFTSSSNFLNVTSTEFDLKNVWVPKVGFEYHRKMKGKLSRAEYAARAGYIYYKSPYPEMPKDTWYIDNDANFLTSGISLGYRPKRVFRYIGFDYYFEYMAMVKRDHTDLTRTPSMIESDGNVTYNGFSVTIQL